MELLNENDIKFIVTQCGFSEVNGLNWTIESYSDKLVGYLGEHLSLNVYIDTKGTKLRLKLFIKCVPRANDWKANYLRETSFFHKEFVMLSKLFTNFRNEGSKMWRPKALYMREELFVFEDVTQLSYTMPSNFDTLGFEEIMATTEALARFHAQSYVYEEEKSKLLGRPYRIWEDYAAYLTEPEKGQSWRDTGMKAAIDFLKEFSQFRTKYNFAEVIEEKIPKLFNYAFELMKPSNKCRNVVVHRDVWSNNIFLRKMENGKIHALLIDYQTVLYCGPMNDLSSMIYFNTTKEFRHYYTNKIIKHYYSVLSDELKQDNIDVNNFLNRHNLFELYTESLIFGMTQAALIVPIIAMTDEKRREYFQNPQCCEKVNVVSRSKEFIEVAKENEKYRHRVIELLDDLVDTLVFP